MAFYYVKNGGTATADAGRFATKQTGTFAALGVGSHYPTITAAMAATTTPTSNDFILVSDVHSHSYGAVGQSWAGPTGIVDPLNIVSVDDTAIDAKKASTTVQEEVTGSTADLLLTGRWYIFGIYLKSEDNIGFSG